MGFFNATLLFGLAASAVPIVLHLWGRQKPKRYEFPAIRFLTKRIETNRRRMRVRHWSLLLLRVLALAGLALALAQPHVPSDAGGTWLSIGMLTLLGIIAVAFAFWGFATQKSKNVILPLAIVGGLTLVAASIWAAATAFSSPTIVANIQKPAAVAIVIDNSPRLGYEDGELSRIEVARDWADWIVDHYSESSTLAIVDRSPRPPAAAIDIAAARRAIRRLKTLQLMQPLEQKIAAAVSFVSASKIQQRAVYVLTDLTATSWTAGQTSLAARLLEASDVKVQLIDIGDLNSRNRRLGELQLASDSIARGVPSSVSVDVSSNGDFPSDQVTLELHHFENEPSLPVLRNGKAVFAPQRVVDRKRLEVPGGSSASVSLNLPPLEPGTHHFKVSLDEPDPLAIDNVRYLTVSVQDPPRVLLAVDDPDEQKILERALTLSAVPGGEIVDYRVETVKIAQLDSANLADYRVVAIVDPSRDTSAWQDKVTSWTQAGGQLWISLGKNWTGDKSAEIETHPLIGNAIRQWRVPGDGRSVELRNATHPILAPFRGVDGKVPWQLYPVRRYWQIERQETDIFVAGYAGIGHAMLVDRSIGAGRLILLTTPLPGVGGPSRSWNELFSTSEEYWPAFLLVRGSFAYLADRGPGTLNVIVGQPVGLKLGEGGATRYQLFVADSPPVAVEAGDGQIAPGPPNIAGNYWLKSKQNQPGYSCNLRPAETNMRRIEGDKLTAILGAERFQLVKDREQIDWSQTTGTTSESFYAQILLLVCGIFVLEQTLANRFYS